LIQPEPNVHSALVARRYEPAAQPMSEFPWEERSSWLDLLAFWRTTLEILFSPSKAFSSLNYDGGVRSSLVYALVYGSLGHIVGRYWLTLAGIQYGILEADPLGNSLRFAGTSLFAPILLLIYVLVSASLIHLFLLLLGGSHRPLPATIQVVGYVSGATSLLNVVPYLGSLLIPIWTLVLYCVGLATAHQTSKIRVFFALLLPFILAALLIIGIVLLVAVLGIMGFLDSLHAYTL
jgi:hypothetical protein